MQMAPKQEAQDDCRRCGWAAGGCASRIRVCHALWQAPGRSEMSCHRISTSSSRRWSTTAASSPSRMVAPAAPCIADAQDDWEAAGNTLAAHPPQHAPKLPVWRASCFAAVQGRSKRYPPHCAHRSNPSSAPAGEAASANTPRSARQCTSRSRLLCGSPVASTGSSRVGAVGTSANTCGEW